VLRILELNRRMSAYVPPAMRAKVAPEQTSTKGKHSIGMKIDSASMKDFPSLGSNRTSTTPKQAWGRTGGGSNFAEMAKAWAEKDDEDKKRKDEDDLRRAEEEARNRPVYMRRIRSQNSGHSSIYSHYPVSMTEDDYVIEHHNNDQYDDYDSSHYDTPTKSPASNPLGIKRDEFEY
jgi:hypothetical protein